MDYSDRRHRHRRRAGVGVGVAMMLVVVVVLCCVVVDTTDGWDLHFGGGGLLRVRFSDNIYCS